MLIRSASLALALVALNPTALPARPATTASKRASADARLEALAKRIIDGYLRLNPESATQLGDHRFDGRLSDLGSGGRAKQRAWTKAQRAALLAIPETQLSPENQVDRAILRDQLDGALFQLDGLKSWQWNPLAYNPGDAIYGLLSRDFAPLPERMESVKARLLLIPGLLESAKANLKNPPRIYTETAIQQFQGALAMVREDVGASAAQVGMKDELAPAQDKAAKALDDFIAWMKSDLLPHSSGDFRVGKENFRKELRYTLNSDLSMEEILKRAEAGLKTTKAEMLEVAKSLFASYFPGQTETDPNTLIKAVLDRIAEKRPTNDTIVALATSDLKQAADFVRGHALVSVPDEPVKIIVMPEFQRGVAVAYCEAPGPLEAHGSTFFAISPTPADWRPERVQSFFREYNEAMVQDLTVHEAMPGHYLQLAHSNAFKAPTLVRGIFTSGLFAEGWAVYGEQLMARAGYGGPEVRMEQLKMRLRVIINAILDQKIHTRGMTEQQALDLMEHEGFQEEGEAVGKWRRACLSSTQLSTYFVGASEMDDIRAAAEAKAAQDKVAFDQRAFHDRLLSFGSPAPKYARRLMGL
ncbi:MAG TPA: DUF885 domain-containing protein [Holophagaceae bacterium]|jgi:uncharacterized protein (DUF885 family)|nr:DUF885 domain-containing protein [Holophagaceae bacterium]